MPPTKEIAEKSPLKEPPQVLVSPLPPFPDIPLGKLLVKLMPVTVELPALLRVYVSMLFVGMPVDVCEMDVGANAMLKTACALACAVTSNAPSRVKVIKMSFLNM